MGFYFHKLEKGDIAYIFSKGLGGFKCGFIFKQIGKGLVHSVHVDEGKLLLCHGRQIKMVKNLVIISHVCLFCIKKDPVTVEGNNFNIIHLFLFLAFWIDIGDIALYTNDNFRQRVFICLQGNDVVISTALFL